MGERPFGLQVDSAGERLYVANVASNDVSVVDLARLEVLGTIPVGSTPYAVAVTPDGLRAFVTNQHANSISVIDTQQLRVQHEDAGELGLQLGELVLDRDPGGSPGVPREVREPGHHTLGDVNLDATVRL